MIYKVGLTGLIGSGKSLAASYFAKLGVQIIDTDIISHYLTCSGGIAIAAITNEFGKNYIGSDGSLNRQKMRELVFSNENARNSLESVLHPLIFNEVLKQIELAHGVYVIIMVPLLFKSPRYLTIMNRTIFVDCEEAKLILRVMQRNSFTNHEIKAIIDTQLPCATQKNMADDIIDNNKDLWLLRQQVEELDKKYRGLFK